MNVSNYQILTLFVVLVSGSLIGKIRYRSFSLGFAGILISALFFGHLGFRISSDFLDLGLLLFIYSAGLQAGPRFFRTIKSSGVSLFLVGVIPIIVAATISLLLGFYFNLSPELIVGIFSGALTDTTTLVAAIDAFDRTGVKHSSALSVGYTLAYPLSMLLVFGFVHLIPKLLKVNLKEDEEIWKDKTKHDDLSVVIKQFRVSNTNCAGKEIKELLPPGSRPITISHIARGALTHQARPELILELNDVVTVVASPKFTSELKLFFGEEVLTPTELGKNVAVQTIEVSEQNLIGKPLAELKIPQNYKVLITRIKRQGVFFVGQATTILDFGDQIQVIGEPSKVEEFILFAGSSVHKLDETNLLPLILGLFIGILIGSIPITFGRDIKIQLGISGGAFLVSLIAGHLGKIGSYSLYVPQAAKNLCREFGLALFLAAAGTYAGDGFFNTVQTYGVGIVVIGATVTCTGIFTAFFLSRVTKTFNFLSSLGLICGVMSNSTSLAILRDKLNSDSAALTYAAVYPLSFITKIFIAQCLVFILQ
jgi:putative transport protein